MKAHRTISTIPTRPAEGEESSYTPNHITNQTIDCIFDINGSHIVLIKRNHEPFENYWALPGGRQNIGETLEETVVREIEEETGINLELLKDKFPFPLSVFDQETFLDQVRTYHSGEDPRGGNTTVYAVQFHGDVKDIEKKLRNGDDAKEIGIFDKRSLPELAFDHKRFIEEYFHFFKKYKNPIPTTDIIIEYADETKDDVTKKGVGKKGIVLITRKNPPHGLAIPGGFAELGLSLEENAVKEAKEETGLDITIENPNRPFVYSDPKRDPRGHIISNTYYAKGHGVLKAGDDAKTARVYSIGECIELIGKGTLREGNVREGERGKENKEEVKLAFDHEKILRDYLEYKGYLDKKAEGKKTYTRIGVIGRFKPFHLGAFTMLEAMCESAEHVVIGIGSAGQNYKYNLRNPFTPQETKEMIDAALSPKFSNYEIVEIPDFAHIPEYKDGKKWVQEITANYGALDGFVSGDNYVIDLLKQHYNIIHSSDMIPKEKWIYIKGSMVRAEMARGGDAWKAYVPKEVADYICKNKLDERFRKEFGLETLSTFADMKYMRQESSAQEKAHTMEV
ncbi:NUDIX domain-containing protein [Candidatus Woesearchaeota archaeon]|nr:NUDIX domain-containing protein [Candidatus Woesearchaeota archaeon]